MQRSANLSSSINHSNVRKTTFFCVTDVNIIFLSCFLNELDASVLLEEIHGFFKHFIHFTRCKKFNHVTSISKNNNDDETTRNKNWMMMKNAR